MHPHRIEPHLSPSSSPKPGRPDPASRGGFTGRPAPRRLAPPARPAVACPVCRCRSVMLDEVDLGAALLLAECPRCEHRWTATPAVRPAPARRVAVVAASRLDVAAQA